MTKAVVIWPSVNREIGHFIYSVGNGKFYVHSSPVGPGQQVRVAVFDSFQEARAHVESEQGA